MWTCLFGSSNKMKLVHWPLMGWLLYWYNKEGTGRGPSLSRPLVAVPNVTAHPSMASVPITVLLYNGSLLCRFNVPVKGHIKLAEWCLHMLLGIKWYQFVRNDDVRRLTKQPKLTAIIQSRRLTLFGHIMRMDDKADAKRIVASSPADWRRQLSRPRITWLSTVQQDLKQQHLTQQIWLRTALCGG